MNPRHTRPDKQIDDAQRLFSELRASMWQYDTMVDVRCTLLAVDVFGGNLLGITRLKSPSAVRWNTPHATRHVVSLD